MSRKEEEHGPRGYLESSRPICLHRSRWGWGGGLLVFWIPEDMWWEEHGFYIWPVLNKRKQNGLHVAGECTFSDPLGGIKPHIQL